MSFQTQVRLAKEKMLYAERALEDYFRSPMYNPEQEEQLANAVKAARNEFIDQLALLWPNG